MKIQIEIDENLMEEEVIIRCASLNDIVQEVQKAVSEAASGTQTAVFSKGEQEYYFPLSKVLFLRQTETPSTCTRRMISTRPGTGCMNWKRCFRGPS